MYYHVWFVTKYRKEMLFGETEAKIKDCFLEVAKQKKYNILAMETNKDHAHLLVEAENREMLAEIVRVLKCVSAKRVLESTPHLRAGNVKHFWARTFGRKLVSYWQLGIVEKYIRDQKRIPHT